MSGFLFVNLPLAKQAALAIVAACVATLLVGAYVAQVSVEAAEVQRARSVVDVLDALREMTTRAGGFYVRRDSSDDPAAVGRYLTSVDVIAQGPEGARTRTFHEKTPFMVLGDLSAEVRNGLAGVRFRMVSDNPMNPANAADAFESRSLAALRVAAGGDQWLVADNVVRYVRPLKATKACMGCHALPLAASNPVKALYPSPADGAAGGGYGYVEGQLVGLTSVTLARQTLAAVLRSRAAELLTAALAIPVLGAVLWLWVIRRFIRPLRLQVDYAGHMASGESPLELVAPTPSGGTLGSANEIHGLGASLLALHESLALAGQWMRARR